MNKSLRAHNSANSKNLYDLSIHWTVQTTKEKTSLLIIMHAHAHSVARARFACYIPKIRLIQNLIAAMNAMQCVRVRRPAIYFS